MVGIKEILGQRSSKVAEINLGSIVQKISKSVMDDDSEVRYDITGNYKNSSKKSYLDSVYLLFFLIEVTE